MVADKIVDSNSLSAKDSAGNVANSEILKLIENEIEKNITEKLSNERYSIRTEKLFVKDYILKNDDSRISDIQQEKYVAMIFMPNKNVTFTKFSFVVGNADLTNFEISMDGVSFVTDGNNLGTDEKQTFIYSSFGIPLVSAEDYENIDYNNLSALSSGMSLFDIVENEELDYAKYLTDDNTDGCFTLNDGGVKVELKNDEAFTFVEWETKWQSAS